MTAVDPELERHRRTWIGFTWFIKISLLVIVVIAVAVQPPGRHQLVPVHVRRCELVGDRRL